MEEGEMNIEKKHWQCQIGSAIGSSGKRSMPEERSNEKCILINAFTALGRDEARKGIFPPLGLKSKDRGASEEISIEKKK